MSASSNESEKDALMKAIHHAVGKICRNEQQQCGGAPESATSQMSRSALSVLTEMTFHYVTKCLSSDLISFSSHAGRKTITADDVMLVARKSRKLSDVLEKFCETENSIQRDKDVFVYNQNSKKEKGRSEISSNDSLLDMRLTQGRSYIEKLVESSSDDEDFLPRNSKKLKTATLSSSNANFDYEDDSSGSGSNLIYSSQKRIRNGSKLSSQSIRVNETTTSVSGERPVGSQKILHKSSIQQNIEGRFHDDSSSVESPQTGKAEGKSAVLAIELSEDDS